MSKNLHGGFDRMIKNALVSSRGGQNSTNSKIRELEAKLEGSKLSFQEITSIQEQIKALKQRA